MAPWLWTSDLSKEHIWIEQKIKSEKYIEGLYLFYVIFNDTHIIKLNKL